MRNPTEILAPAGSMEALKAAVHCGADAVYLGAGSLNARRSAANFTEDSLCDAVSFSHLRGTQVHLTLNTLVRDEERKEALELIELGCRAGVDAFIVQDLGMAALARAAAPDIPLHASTQMAVMTADGMNRLKDLGFKRIVLPRELSLEEIRKIRERTDLELEIFVHGALCMCVSGQCYLSGMLGGRSGNRGLCAQPCRLPFAAEGMDGRNAGAPRHDLSLKDLDLIQHIPELMDAGICSFKIEGRMKRPEYVAAAVTACINQLEGKTDEALDQDLRNVFSRSGFTDGYLIGNRGPHMFGTRTKEDVTAAGPALERLRTLYAEAPRSAGPTRVDFVLEAEVGKPAALTAAYTGPMNCLNHSLTVHSESAVEAAQNKPTEEETVVKQLSKTGGTAFHTGTIDVRLGESCFLPASVLNQLRRDALDQVTAQIVDAGKKEFHSVDVDALTGKTAGSVAGDEPGNVADSAKAFSLDAARDRAKDSALVLRFDNVKQIPEDLFRREDVTVILPLTADGNAKERLRNAGIRFGVEIPRALYEVTGDGTSRVEQQLDTAKAHGAAFAFAGTLDGVVLAQKHGLPVLGGPTLNVYNSTALAEYRKLGVKDLTVSIEMTLDEIGALQDFVPDGDPAAPFRKLFLAYGRTPLMLFRNCPIQNSMSCDQCRRQQSLTDRKGVQFPVRCVNGAAELLNSRPIWMADRLHEVHGIDALLLWFTVETPKEAADIITATAAQQPPATEEFTRGLYYRGVL